MTVFVAFLRAINVGGTGLLPMKELAALCVGLGYENVRTFIQSGNVILEAGRSEQALAAELEKALAAKMGRPVGVVVRTGSELRAILEANPFPNAEGSKVAVMLLPDTAPAGLLDGVVAPGREELKLGSREIYIHYPDGMGRSKLKVPSAKLGTVRNINTICKLAEMTGA